MGMALGQRELWRRVVTRLAKGHTRTLSPAQLQNYIYFSPERRKQRPQLHLCSYFRENTD